MELPELQVLQRNACTGSHAQAITGVDEGVGRSSKDAACTTRGQQHGLGVQLIQITGFQLQRGDANDVTLLVADQVQCHPLHEEVGLGSDVLLVQRVQHGVASAVSSGTGALYGLFAVVGGVAAEGALVNGAVGVAVKRHAEVLQLHNHFGSFAAHEFHGVLVRQPVAPLDGVVEVIVPVVVGHIAQRCGHATLGCHGVRARRENLGQGGNAQTCA